MKILNGNNKIAVGSFNNHLNHLTNAFNFQSNKKGLFFNLSN